MNRLQSIYFYSHLFRTFFSSFEEWEKLSCQIGNEPSLTQQEYTDLFQGTDASIYVPLWASACKGTGKVLLNETTLEVIRFYKKHGYQPVRIDGNPPDYIGEQFRFLEYLAVCGIKEPSCEEEIIHEFLGRFTADTVAEMGKALKRHTDNPDVRFLIQKISKFIKGKYDEIDFPADLLEEFDSYAWEKHPPVPLEDEKLIHSGGINNCGGRCCINITVREGCILRLGTDESSNSPQIRSCQRGSAYRSTFLSTGRLRYPMKRIGKRGEGKFKRISWDEAIQEITSETMRLKKTYGPGSRHVIYGTGVSAVMNPVGLMRRLLYLDGGELGAYNSYSSACTEYVTPYIYGDGSAGNSSDDVLNSKLLILWGHNPAETLFGAFRNHYLSLAKAKGLRIIVVDPRQSDTAITYAQEWVPIRPGTDSAMADAMAYVIWNEGLQDQQFMDKFCVGFDELHMPEGLPFGESYHSYLFGIKDGIHKTPMWAEEITGVPADTIERIAREYAVTKPACIMPGLGLQRTANGEQSIRSMAMLSCLTGNVGISGGGTGANDWFDLHEPVTMPMPENPYPGKIPSFLWSKAVSSGTEMKTVRDGIKGVEKLDSNLKLIYCMASNTLVNQHSNINETVALLQDTSKCEFIVCSDIFMTPSAKFADILLPATSLFEGENIANPWMDINYVLYVNQAIQPIFETRFEYDWIKEVARQMGLYEEYTEGHETVREWLETSYVIARKHNPELVEFEVFRENGCYQYQDNKTTIAYRENIEQGKPFKTPSGKIEIFSKTLYDMNNPEEIPGLPRYTPCVEGPEDTLTQKYPLQLIGYHTKSRTHSIHDKNELLEELDPPALWLHPDDAAARGIRSGQDVLVFNDRGQVRIPVRITTRIMRGVVAMSQGGWYTPDKDGTDTRGSINVLTMTHKPTPLAKGNPQHTNLVEVKLYID